MLGRGADSHPAHSRSALVCRSNPLRCSLRGIAVGERRAIERAKALIGGMEGVDAAIFGQSKDTCCQMPDPND